jgi:6-phosphogluconate dehydrogenase
MKIGLIGLGKMGGNIVLNLLDHGHDVVVYNRDVEKTNTYRDKGALPAYSYEELVAALPTPRVIWLMVTAGSAVDSILETLTPMLSHGDIVIDGGNSFYKDTLRRSPLLAEKGIHLLDVGTSGGITGARHGACLMIGGAKEAYTHLEGAFKDISIAEGYKYFGKSGSGHFIKMIHNGIEYGMMQAIGEGFEVIEKSEFDIDMADTAHVWRHGSVIRGWLMDLIEEEYKKDPTLSGYSGTVGLSGEGEWSVSTAHELDVPVPTMEASVDMRIKSKEEKRYQGKVIQALRYGFGGHSQPS